MRDRRMMTAGLLLSLASFAWGQRGGFHGGGGVHGGGGFAARGALRAGSGSAPRGGMRAGGMAFVGPTRWFRAGSNFRRPERGPRIIIGDFRRGRDFGRRRFYPYGAYPVYGCTVRFCGIGRLLPTIRETTTRTGMRSCSI